MASDRLFANLAFISYSRKADVKVASRLQIELEKYAIPGPMACDRTIHARALSYESSLQFRVWSMSRPAARRGREVCSQIDDMRRGKFPTTVDVSPDESLKVTRTMQLPNTARLTLSKSPSQRVNHELEHSDWISCVAFDATRARVMTGSLDHSAKLWNATDGPLIVQFDGVIGVWDVNYGDHLMDVTAQTDQCVSGRFAEDGQTLMVADGRGRLFRFRGGK